MNWKRYRKQQCGTVQEGNICFFAVIRVVFTLRKASRDMADIHFGYALSDSKARTAQRLYRVRFPQRKELLLKALELEHQL
ncbi:hypothetical protein CDAR_14371 [Caerostris darwini]|uniref:DUF4817 domain-containing protein n=1 Tax=Caerostris darwini TaxID=1538125 RepID=A0AAV4QFF7_9ARAC|nr:hypothetical protein CDAR_14371 [Caerostris darwini]